MASSSARAVSPQPNQNRYHRSPSLQIKDDGPRGQFPPYQPPSSSGPFEPSSHLQHGPSPSLSIPNMNRFNHHPSPSTPTAHQQFAPSSPHKNDFEGEAQDDGKESQLQRWRKHVSGQVNRLGSNSLNNHSQQQQLTSDSVTSSAIPSSTMAHLRTPTIGRLPNDSSFSKLSTTRSNRRLSSISSTSAAKTWLRKGIERTRQAISALYVSDSGNDHEFHPPPNGNARTSVTTPNPNRRRSSLAMGPVPALSPSGWCIVALLFILGLYELFKRSSSPRTRRGDIEVMGRNPFSVIDDLSPAARISSHSSFSSSSAVAPAILAGQDRVWKHDVRTSTDDQFTDTSGSPHGDTTAIVLHWKRTDNVIIIVSHLCRYTFFDSVVVWNNNPAIHLSRSDFASTHCPPSRLRIFNSPRNQLFVARYLACVQSHTPNCYFQDDDWLVWPIRSLYSQFSRDPHGPVVVHTNPGVSALYALEWCFYHSKSIHTCFAWMGTGAFVSRSHVVHYLDTLTEMAYKRDEMAHADNSFATFLNRAPYVLQSRLTQLPQPFGHSDGEGIKRNKDFIQKGLINLFIHMNATHPHGQSVTLPTTPLRVDVSTYRRTPSPPLPPHPYAHHVRSPCHTDTCSFITNINQLPPPDSIPYPGPTIVRDLETWENHLGSSARGWIEGGELFNEEEAWARKWSYWNAVDGDMESCFRSVDVIKRNDYIGLGLLAPVDSQWTPTLSLIFTLEHWVGLSKTFVVEVSVDGYKWLEPPTPASTPICHLVPTRSTLPDLSFPPSSFLSSEGQAVLELDRHSFASSNKLVTWFNRRRRRSEGLRECKIRLGTKLQDGKEAEGWRFIRLRAVKSENMGWGVYDIRVEK